MDIHQQGDTIAAISTPMGVGGVGIVRVSGDKAEPILHAIFRRHNGDAKIQSHTMRFGHIIDKKGIVVDEVLVCFMRKPGTYTREDVVEINCHGGLRCLEGVLQCVLDNGARLAEPGEFTKRAFLNGRIDLSQAEAVIDVIHAKTELSRRVAVRQLKGGLSETCKALSDDILTMIAHIEASIDYPEHDMEAMNLTMIQEQSLALIEKLSRLISNANKGVMMREGIETAIIGRPNVGKSSLLNFLLDEERAIVTDIPGTTRDVLQEYVNINDIPLKIIDTAGIRPATDTIEKIGVEKSKYYAENADLVLVVLDASASLSDGDKAILNMVAHKKILVLLNKTDLTQEMWPDDIYPYVVDPSDVILISLKRRTGLEVLYNKIKDMFYGGDIALNEEILIYNMRHKNALIRCAERLQAAVAAINARIPEDLVSIDLQDALRAIGEITGETVSDDIIDKIFTTFCLGK